MVSLLNVKRNVPPYALNVSLRSLHRDTSGRVPVNFTLFSVKGEGKGVGLLRHRFNNTIGIKLVDTQYKKENNCSKTDIQKSRDI